MSNFQRVMESCRDRTKIRNPYKGQCVSRTSAIGAPLAAMLASAGNGTWVRSYAPGASRCSPNSYNLATGKCVKTGDSRGVARAIAAFVDEYLASGGARTASPSMPSPNGSAAELRRQLDNARRQLQNRNDRNLARKVTGNIFGRIDAAQRANERRRFKNASNNAVGQLWTATAMAGALQANFNQAAGNLQNAREELLRKHAELTERNARLAQKNAVIGQKDAIIRDLLARIRASRGNGPARPGVDTTRTRVPKRGAAAPPASVPAAQRLRTNAGEEFEQRQDEYFRQLERAMRGNNAPARARVPKRGAEALPASAPARQRRRTERAEEALEQEELFRQLDRELRRRR